VANTRTVSWRADLEDRVVESSADGSGAGVALLLFRFIQFIEYGPAAGVDINV